MWGKYMVVVGLAIIVPYISGDAWGANFQIDAVPTAAFDPVTFAPIPLTLDSSGNLVGNRSMMVQVDIDVFSSGYNAAHDERGFGAMTFSLDLFGSFSNTTRPGWMPNNPLVSTSALGDLSPRWDDNLDAGKQGDLKYILLSNPVISNPNPFDPRPSLTTGAPVKVGSVFVDWDGVGSGGIRISPDQVAYAQNSDGKLQMFQPGEYTMVGGTFHTAGWQPPSPPLPPPPAPVASRRLPHRLRQPFLRLRLRLPLFRRRLHLLPQCRPQRRRQIPRRSRRRPAKRHRRPLQRTARGNRRPICQPTSKCRFHHLRPSWYGGPIGSKSACNSHSRRESMPPRRCSLATGSCSWPN